MNYWKLRAALERRERRLLELKVATEKANAECNAVMVAEGLVLDRKYVWNDADETIKEAAPSETNGP